MLRLTLAALALCVAGTAQAASTGGYSSIVIFGDSLSDTGNLYAATGGAIPAAPYVNGRFSNGPIWADDMIAAFNAKGLFGASFAYGSANVIENGDFIPDLGTQIGIFETNVPDAALGDNPLAAIWMGANDLFDALDTMDTAGVVATGVAAAAGVAQGIAALAAGGITDFVVLNLPDLALTPAYAMFQTDKAAAAHAGSVAFNTALAGQLDLLRAGGLNITGVDIFSLFNDLHANPSQYGLSGNFAPCYIPSVYTCDLVTEAGKLTFFDPVHPSDTVQGAVADAVSDAITPAAVPLPASATLLMGAMIGIAALRRRAQA
ncbi:MAG: hypothetical protein DI533_07930 [Cereibacter sphaeroides]|uniref:Uncharacterized protein n=1 Tax=Cereibacter sphaeroides TaxID=1063 RepID=A0A2W5UAU0_CERSP|nr:MAG: hypothetical protein DI533_07930 [Cereibacter sphaeroides]